MTDFIHGSRVTTDEDIGTVVTDQAAWFTYFEGPDNRMKTELSERAPDSGMVAVFWDGADKPTWIYESDLTVVYGK